MKGSYDVIVVGLGGMGVATAAELSRRGARVLGLDRGAIPNAIGSSHGDTRILRLCYYEHPDYVPLLRRAHEQWRAFAARAAEPVLEWTGALYLGPHGCAVVDGAAHAARTHDLPHETLTRDAVRARFPQFEVPDDHIGIFEPEAGVLRPERIIGIFAENAMRAGAELHGHESVCEWRQEDDGVTVRTDRGTYRAAHLVLCAGAWMGSLLEELEIPLTVSRQVVAWLWPARPERFSPPAFPIWGIDAPGGCFWYGFPLNDGRPGLKVALHRQGPIVDPNTIDREVSAGEEEEIRSAVRQFIPGADGPVLSRAVCMYTNTPDGHFVLDRHPEYDRVTIASGFSGHGFKFVGVIGEVLADLALDGGTSWPVEFLRLGRLQGDSGRIEDTRDRTRGLA